jgi:hypothetical protein
MGSSSLSIGFPKGRIEKSLGNMLVLNLSSQYLNADDEPSAPTAFQV